MRQKAIGVLVVLLAWCAIVGHFGEVPRAHRASAKALHPSDVAAARKVIAQINTPERIGRDGGSVMRIGIENNVMRTFPILDTVYKQATCWLCYWADGVVVPNFYVFKKTTVRVAIPDALKKLPSVARTDRAIVAWIEKEVTQFHKKAFRNNRQASVHDVVVKKHGPHDYVVLSRYSLRSWNEQDTMELIATLSLAGLSIKMLLEAKKNPFRAFHPKSIAYWSTAMLAIAEFVRRLVQKTDELHLVREAVFR
jgi:hypothetical protein